LFERILLGIIMDQASQGFKKNEKQPLNKKFYAIASLKYLIIIHGFSNQSNYIIRIED
jgi:hypothetical protein